MIVVETTCTLDCAHVNDVLCGRLLRLFFAFSVDTLDIDNSRLSNLIGANSKVRSAGEKTPMRKPFFRALIEGGVYMIDSWTNKRTMSCCRSHTTRNLLVLIAFVNWHTLDDIP